MVALGSRTAGGVTLFAKNSDREPNEAQQLLSIPAAQYPAGAEVACTYLRVSQVRRTHAVLLSKPFWMWGAEMGVNEHGVAIGNEAVFTREPPTMEPALLGMDLVRLALERSATAADAIGVITTLLERHGQGGDGGYTRPFRYDNSFLVADPSEAWVLETAGRNWVAKRVADTYAISNGLTITTGWDLASDDLVDHALRQGWCGDVGSFDFAACYGDPERTRASACAARRGRVERGLAGGVAAAGAAPGTGAGPGAGPEAGPGPGPVAAADVGAGAEVAEGGAVTSGSRRLAIQGAMTLLRDHGAQPLWQGSPPAPVAKTVCMHTSGGANQISQTTGSLVVALFADGPLCFATGTAAPCTGVFKPVWLDGPVPGQDALPGSRFDPATLFWRHERLHRVAVQAEGNAVDAYREERDAMERAFVAEALELRSAEPEHRLAFSERCFAEAAAAGDLWLERVERIGADAAVGTAAAGVAKASPLRSPSGVVPAGEAYRAAWRTLNQAAGLPDGSRRSGP